MDRNQLTQPQLRSISSSLINFEKALRKTDGLLTAGDENGILYFRKVRLAPRDVRRIRGKISRALDELRDLANRLEIEPGEESLAGIVMAEMSLSWESLEESLSKRMRGYGPINPTAFETLDPIIEHLAGEALEIGRLVQASSSNFVPE